MRGSRLRLPPRLGGRGARFAGEHDGAQNRHHGNDENDHEPEQLRHLRLERRGGVADGREMTTVTAQRRVRGAG